MVLDHLLPYGEREAHKASPSMTSKDQVVESEEFIPYAELVGNMASYIGLHLGLTNFRYIK